MEALTLRDISTLCSGMQYAQGFRHVRAGDVLTPWVGEQAIGGQIRNPVRPHTVRIHFDENGRPSPSCSCGGHAMRQRYCQHVVALLIAWATNPSSFARYKGPDTAPLAENAVNREGQDPLVAFRAALDKIEALLLDLFWHGLVTLNSGRAQFIRRMGSLASAQGLGRIADALGELEGEVGLLSAAAKSKGRPRRAFDEARYAQALSAAWHLTQAARQALDEGDLARLREIAALELADEPAVILEAAELVELAYHTSLDRGSVTETSYLLSLEDGQLLAERVRTAKTGRIHNSKVSHRSIVRGRVAIYPACDVDEVILLDVEEAAPLGPDAWQRAYGWAETSGEALVGRLREVVAGLPICDCAHVWFAPSRVVVGSEGVRFLDETGASLPVEPAQAVGRVLLDAPLLAAFGTLGRSAEGLRFTALSLLSGGDAPTLVALSG